MAKLIIPLNELEYKDLPLVGGKAAVLRILTMQGAPVPEAIILTGEFYQWIIQNDDRIREAVQNIKYCAQEELKFHLEEIISGFRDFEYPDEFLQLLINRLPLLHFPHFNNLAVRPSPVFHESPTEIISDLHLSVMNVRNIAELKEAIKLILASTWGFAAYAFRQENFVPHQHISMAVIIQKMAMIEYSGVVYSRHPRDSRYILINAGWGMPEAIINGEVEYDTYILRREKPENDSFAFSPGEKEIAVKKRRQIYKGSVRAMVDVSKERQNFQILDPREQLEIANFACKIEEAFGEPHVITWGKERGIIILNSRAAEKKQDIGQIWTIPLRDELYSPVYSNFGISLSRQNMEASINILASNVGEKKFHPNSLVKKFLNRPFLNLGELTFLFQKLGIRQECTKRAYQGDALFLPETKSGKVQEQMDTGILNSMKMKRWTGRIEEQAEKNCSDLASSLGKMKKLRFNKLDRKELGEFISLVLKESLKIRDRYEILTIILFSLGMLSKIEKNKTPVELYQNIPTVTEIYEIRYLLDILNLAQEAVTDPAVVDFFRQNDHCLGEKMGILQSTSFFPLLLAFIKKHDCAGLFPLDVSSPLFGENPFFLIKMISVLLRLENLHGKIFLAKRAADEFGKKKPPERPGGFLQKLIPGNWTVDSLSDLLHHSILLASRHLKFNIELVSLLRKALLEMGKIFADMKFIEAPDDIFFLEVDEVLRATKIKFTDYSKLIPQRRENLEIFADYIPPPLFSGSRLDISIPSIPDYQPGEPLCRIPLSPGTAEGRARIIRRPAELFAVEPDEIIIIDRLNFILSPLLLTAAGVIIQRCNPFMVEYPVGRILGIPSVAGIQGIMDVVGDGDHIKIDGDRGIVVLQ